MLESPDYFFRVREIGRLRQTKISYGPRELRILDVRTFGNKTSLVVCMRY